MAVADKLRSLGEPSAQAKAGLYGPHLLHPDTAHGVVFSFTLYESGVGGNFLRVQTDNYNQPLNINQGTKLELGSTAKLRTLACYLDLISELHARLSNKTGEELRTVHADSEDALLIWAISYLSTTSNKGLSAMLNAAIDRTYSANPTETFFTGGGAHTFANFEREDNGRILTVREAFERSVNLVFIRLLRDIIRSRIFEHREAREVLDSNASSPLRLQYLRRFADMEGQQYLENFYMKYKARPNSAWLTLLEQSPLTPTRFAAIYRYVRPDADFSQFQQFAVSHTVLVRPDAMLGLYTKYGPHKFILNDLAYLAHAHPLDLWLAEYLSRHPSASFQEVLTASGPVRQESYSWLFKSSRKNAQDMRIGIILERDAFEDIHREWARLGFPFSQLVPSLATAIGSSGDNPDALAILAGIILNNGVRYPSIRIRKLHFGESTPMETVLEPKEATAERVMPEEMAKVLRRELIGVVEHGTGQRARKSIVLDDGTVILVGGKTGTGDNRIETVGPHGTVLGSKVRNRTAAFVFTIGDRFFGTVLAYSAGNDAAAQSFTSALAVQVFRDLIPPLRPLLTNGLKGEHH